MKKFLSPIALAVSVIFLSWLLGRSATQKLTTEYQSNSSAPQYFLATVKSIITQKELPQENGDTFYFQTIEVTSIPKGEPFFIPVGSEFQPLNKNQLLTVGRTVVLAKQQAQQNQETHSVVDVYRLPALIFLFVGFIVIVIALVTLQGFFSLLGIIVSMAVLFLYMIPVILTGTSPLIASLISSTGIAATTIYLSHGFKRSSHISFASLILTLLAVTTLASVTITTAHFVGLGSEEAAFLQYGLNQYINLRGLLLAGIILGALGVLDDIIVAQVSTVGQLLVANPKMPFEKLYKSALTVGKDHIASLVNTLVLAYAGTNLPLFILFYLDHQTPIWVILNNETLAEEIVRTLVGTIGLVMAVPLTTLVASIVLISNPKHAKKVAAERHSHA